MEASEAEAVAVAVEASEVVVDSEEGVHPLEATALHPPAATALHPLAVTVHHPLAVMERHLMVVEDIEATAEEAVEVVDIAQEVAVSDSCFKGFRIPHTYISGLIDMAQTNGICLDRKCYLPCQMNS